MSRGRGGGRRQVGGRECNWFPRVARFLLDFLFINSVSFALEVFCTHVYICYFLVLVGRKGDLDFWQSVKKIPAVLETISSKLKYAVSCPRSRIAKSVTHEGGQRGLGIHFAVECQDSSDVLPDSD